MKCAYHPEVEATGLCVSCGRAVCPACRLLLADRVYCQSCADEAFVGKSTKKSDSGRSGMLTAGGIVSIAAGAMAIFSALIYLVIGLVVGGFSGDSDAVFVAVIMFAFGVPFMILGIMAVIGGIFALRRQRFGLALAGAICGIPPSTALGVVATIFIAISREEFKKAASKTPSASPLG